MKIHLVDEIMSSGKSHWMMKQMEEWKQSGEYEQFVYISPLLSEVGGEKKEDEYVTGRVQDTAPGMHFQFPKPLNGSKMRDARKLIKDKRNVAATHALFALVDEDSRTLLKEARNVLVIDESVQAIHQYDGVSTQGITNLIRSGELKVDENTNKLSWNHKDYPMIETECGVTGKGFEYSELVDLCDSGYAYLNTTDEKAKSKVIIWQYPKELLECFDDVWVLTYMFDGSVMKSWCEINNIEVERIRPNLKRSTEDVKEWIRENIVLHDSPSLRRIGEYRLSQTGWRGFDNQEINDVRTVIESTLKNKLAKEGVRCDDILITCPKYRWEADPKGKEKFECPGDIKGKGYAKATWIPSSCRATNKYSEKTCVIYCLDKYPDNYVSNFCSRGGYPLHRDKYAMAEALQTAFRGCVRDGKKMHLVFLSNRMRKLYSQWLNGEGVFADES